MEQDTFQKTIAKVSAQDKLIDLVSRRDHTEKELIKKLRLRKYTELEICAALNWAKDRGYLKTNEQMSILLNESLKRQLKGERLRAHELSQKGAKLPPVDSEEEVRMAALWVQKKQPPKDKIRQRLQMRGYSAQTIQKLIKSTGDDHFEES